MLEPPALDPSALIACVAAEYAIALDAVEFLPLGADSAAAVYRGTCADGTRYLLKLRRGALNTAGLRIPRYLCDLGLPHILAALYTTDQRLWTQLDDRHLIVYPFIDGNTAADVGLAAAQWTALGQLLRQVHDLALPPELLCLLRPEPWRPDWRELIDELDQAVRAWDGHGAEAYGLVALWRVHAAKIQQLSQRADQLAALLRAEDAPLVLCHADLHTWNILVAADGQFWVIDWDATMLGRRERDLMFMVGGIGAGLVAPAETRCFLAGYGPIQLDQRALAYYRCAWAVQDIASYGADVLLRAEVGPADKRQALRYFAMQFDPGNIVDIALATSVD